MHVRAPVAQWIEQPPPKGQVGRSIRLRGATSSVVRSVLARFAHSAPDPSPATRYRIVPLDPHAHLFEVRCTVDDPDPGGPALPAADVDSRQLPDPRIRAALRAACARKRAARPSRSTRKPRTSGARRPAHGPLTVVAEVYAFDLSVRAAYLDARAAISTARRCSCVRKDAPTRRARWKSSPPEGPALADWRVATTLPRAGAAPRASARIARRTTTS